MINGFDPLPTFREVSGTADFEFAWRVGIHGGRGHDSFDGPGNILAHAYYPPPCGGADIGLCDFDDAETWSMTSATGFHLEAVALHEIGHLLGLRHSTESGAVMSPNYSGLTTLHADDESRIIALFKRKQVPFVRHSSRSDAYRAVRNAGLIPRFIGPTSSNAWVRSQSPSGGTECTEGTVVTLTMSDDLIP